VCGLKPHRGAADAEPKKARRASIVIRQADRGSETRVTHLANVFGEAPLFEGYEGHILFFCRRHFNEDRFASQMEMRSVKALDERKAQDLVRCPSAQRRALAKNANGNAIVHAFEERPVRGQRHVGLAPATLGRV